MAQLGLGCGRYRRYIIGNGKAAKSGNELSNGKKPNGRIGQRAKAKPKYQRKKNKSLK